MLAQGGHRTKKHKKTPDTLEKENPDDLYVFDDDRQSDLIHRLTGWKRSARLPAQSGARDRKGRKSYHTENWWIGELGVCIPG